MVLSHFMRKSGTRPRFCCDVPRGNDETHGVICFWAVMSPEMAAQVQQELACDRLPCRGLAAARITGLTNWVAYCPNRSIPLRP